ncbi:CHASE domain-containing protein [Zobellia galactanivorans]|uniref:CHASE domain-containing protein n=1 Tax=Zobellia galactanivorans (strain DSM 12802 / CCUG 47099 / CIP 106680 / NCIMB 13871 / Dsij) TaxID=63186 RepID=UPI001C06B06F|nr:CHASE domain-containing protein [Zobellia galactanivorans]MBU3028001.1 CHASE domain-containing protein [Zobellia galactanivorans]
MTTLQILKYLAVLLIGSSLALFIFFSINNRYLLQNKSAVDSAVTKSVIKLEDELNKINLVVESMAFFYENKSYIPQKLFERFTDPFIKELNGIKALAWAPKVEDSLRTKFEEYRTITQIDSSGQLVPTTSNNVHYPVTTLNPVVPFKQVLGYDVFSDSTKREAILRSIETSKPAISGPIQLISEADGVGGILALKSVSSAISPENKGIVLGVYRMDKLISETLKSEIKVFNLCIHDHEAGDTLLFSNVHTSKTHKDQYEKTVIKKSINAIDRKWDVHFVPKQEYLSFPHVFESYVVLILGLATTLLLAHLARRRDNHNDRLEARVLLRTAELEESNKQKENLLREIHHRVKNNLQITSSLINMQKRKLVSKEAITALEDSQARISAIALTHQKIYQDKDSKAVNLHEYLKDLMEYQNKISPSFSYKIDCPEISIDLDKAVPLALIISELVTNAVKHAYPDKKNYNELRIDVKKLDKSNISLTIRDNGKGLPEGFAIENAEGIGFDIIKALCRQISAELSYNSDSTGTNFSVIFNNQT